MQAARPAGRRRVALLLLLACVQRADPAADAQPAAACSFPCAPLATCNEAARRCDCPPGLSGADCTVAAAPIGAAQNTSSSSAPLQPQGCARYAAFSRSIHEDLAAWALTGITAPMLDEARTYTIQGRSADNALGFLLRAGTRYVVDGQRADMALRNGVEPVKGTLKWLLTYVRALAHLADTYGALLPDAEFVVAQGDFGPRHFDLSKPDTERPPWAERRSVPVMRYCKSDDSPEILVPYVRALPDGARLGTTKHAPSLRLAFSVLTRLPSACCPPQHHFYEKRVTRDLIDAPEEGFVPFEQRKAALFGNHHPYDRVAHTPSTARVGADGGPLPAWARSSTRIYLQNVSAWAGADPNVTGIPMEINTRPLGMRDWAQYKYILHVDGITCSTKLEQELPLGSLILKESSGFRSFYHRLLAPYEHYVPYWRHRPQELLDALAWAAAHEAESAAIAAAGRAFAKRYLHKRALTCYWRMLLAEYARLQRFQPGATLNASRLVPADEYLRWAKAGENGTGALHTAAELELDGPAGDLATSRR